MKLYFLFAVLLLRNSLKPPLVYPEVPRNESFVETIHSMQVHDPYRWLEDIDTPKVQNFIESQNAITVPYLSRNGLREKIRKSLKSLSNYAIYDPPKKKGKNYFTMESSESQVQKVLYVQESLDGEQSILLDPGGTTSIYDFFPSENGEIIAYILSEEGSDWSTVRFRNVSNGTDFPEVLTNTKFTRLSWTHDNKGIFYTRYPSFENRNGLKQAGFDEHQKIYYHILGTRQSNDVLVVEFPSEPHWFLDCEVSDDGKYLIVYIREILMGPVQIYFVALPSFINHGYPQHPALYSILTNFDSEYHYVTNEGPLFIFRTNRKAPNFRLVGINFYNPGEKYWDYDFLEEDPHHVLDWAVAVDRNKLVVSYLTDVRSRLQILTISGRIITTFPVEDGIVRNYAGSKKNTEFFYKLSHILSPGKIFHVDFNEDHIPKPILYKESLISGYNASEFVAEQKFFKSKDGTRIPIFIAHKKDVEFGESTPTLLNAFGGFSSISHDFQPENLIFLNYFNGVYALANIHIGEKWYSPERIFKKQNSFDDFQSAAEFLVNNNITSAGKLIIRGNSNGGLTVAASINQRPELFAVAITQDGVTDLLRFYKRMDNLTPTTEYEDSDIKNDNKFKFLVKNSPLHNVRMPDDNVTQYPSTLLVATTSHPDGQFDPSQSFKLIAELQHVIGGNSKQTNPLLLRVGSGEKSVHGSGSRNNDKPTEKQIDAMTDILAFIQRELKLKFVE